jgi:hypothetical protein
MKKYLADVKPNQKFKFIGYNGIYWLLQTYINDRFNVIYEGDVSRCLVFCSISSLSTTMEIEILEN